MIEIVQNMRFQLTSLAKGVMVVIKGTAEPIYSLVVAITSSGIQLCMLTTTLDEIGCKAFTEQCYNTR